MVKFHCKNDSKSKSVLALAPWTQATNRFVFLHVVALPKKPTHKDSFTSAATNRTVFSIHCTTTQGAKVSPDAKSDLLWESVIGQSDYFGPLGTAATII